MTRYVPIPSVPIDPRNEREIVEQASAEIIQSSNGLLSDFSDGSPMRAILEGQAFAFNEFLFYFNQIPDQLLTEWVGPFLGAQRRAGVSAVVEVEVFLSAVLDEDYVVPAGFTVTSTGSVRKNFALTEDIIIPRGFTSGKGIFRCKTRGTSGNVEPLSIKEYQPLQGISRVENAEAGFGGEDIETLKETKERFLSLIRRRVPVSQDDWRGFFQDLFGYGTQSFIKFNPSSRVVHFRILKPGNLVPTETELEFARAILEANVPATYQIDLKPIPLEYLDLEAEVSFRNLSTTQEEVARATRESLVSALSGEGLPSDVNLSISDLNGNLSLNLPQVFSGGQPYKNPDILSLKGYMKPREIEGSRSVGRVVDYDPSFVLQQKDLVLDSTSGDLFEVLQNFNPLYPSKSFYSIAGYLQLRVTKEYVSGESYKTGDVIADPGGVFYRVVLNPYVASGNINTDFTRGNLSSLKSFSTWAVGTSYSRGSAEAYNPEILEAEQEDFPSPVFISSDQIGKLVWTVERSFTREVDTTNLGTLQSESVIAVTPTAPENYATGTSYSAGDYIVTSEVSNEEFYDPSIFYVDEREGVVQRYFYVEEDFTLEEIFPEVKNNLSFYQEEGLVTPVGVIDLEDSIFTTGSQKYQARFNAGQYIDSGDGRIFITSTPFTPFTLDLNVYIDSNFLLEVSPDTAVTTSSFFRLNAGDTTELVSNGRRVRYKVKRSFTPVYNPEIYLNLLEPTDTNVNRVSFYDAQYRYEDTLRDVETGELYKVIRPFSPSNETLKQLASLGYVQKLVTEVTSVQTGEDFVTVPGEVSVSVKREGLPFANFYVTEGSDLVPVFFGEALF